jgi:uncharacterized membrane protein HdeD (DUF308 family)
MKHASKNWLLLLICGVALAAASILVLVESEQVVSLLIYVAGFALFLLGIALCVMAFVPSRRDERTQLLIFALGNTALGVIIMLASDIFMLLVGLAIALNGAGLVLEGLHLKRLGSSSWMNTLIAGVAIVALGIVVAVFFRSITAAIGISIGLVMLTAGLAFIVFALIARKSDRSEAAA